MKEHGLGELPPAEVIIRACLCREAILQVRVGLSLLCPVPFVN